MRRADKSEREMDKKEIDLDRKREESESYHR